MVTGGLVCSRVPVGDRQTPIGLVRNRPYSGIFVGARPTGRRTQSPRDQFDSARSQRSVLAPCASPPRSPVAEVRPSSVVVFFAVTPTVSETEAVCTFRVSRSHSSFPRTNENLTGLGKRARSSGPRQTGSGIKRCAQTTARSNTGSVCSPRERCTPEGKYLCAWFRADPRPLTRRFPW